MAMDEQKIIEQLEELTKDTKVPKKLLPENIMNTVKELQTEKYPEETGGNQNDVNKKVISFRKIRQSGITKKLAGIVSAAAVLIVVAAVFYRMGSVGGNSTDNNILIPIPADSVAATADTGMEEQAKELAESYVIAQTGNISGYDDVYDELKKYKTAEKSWIQRLFDSYDNQTEGQTDAGVVPDEVVFETANLANGMDTSAAYPGGSASGDYSKTNVQTIGIDEADIIKTDGKYIYYASSNLHSVTIYSVNKDQTEAVCNLYVEGIGSMDEIYVDGDILLAAGTSFRDGKRQAAIVKYNITDRKNPEYVGSFTQEGDSVETRKIGDIVYVVTEVYSDVENMRKNYPETYVPAVCGEILPPESIYIPDNTKGTAYTVISSIDITEDMKQIDSAAVLGFDGTFYMGNENMYLYRTEYSSERFTDIRKIDYVVENGLIGAVTEGKIPGEVKDTFAVNEYNGYLRVMTTSYPTYSSSDSVNNVFVLDKDLNVVGSVEGLAQGERIYSARYMGNTAYFVTYRETDPLYSVDLSDPENPKIMGALKIPGFSEYLHNYGNGMLLGIGIEQIENKNGWRDDYIKLSMFDITDPYNVSEKDKKILYDANYSPALYDYKLVMIDPQKNIFGFVTQDYNNLRTSFTYRIYTYTGTGFAEVVNFDLDGIDDIYRTRSVYIGDYVYIVNEDGVTAYSIGEM